MSETHKQEALYSYKKYKAYRPLTTYWAEADQIVPSTISQANRTIFPACSLLIYWPGYARRRLSNLPGNSCC